MMSKSNRNNDLGLGINITKERENAFDKAIQLLSSHGVIVVDPVNMTVAHEKQEYENLWSLLLMTFSEDMASYLSELSNTAMRSLTDLIEFNLNHTEEEFHPEFAPNQLIFEWSNRLSNVSSSNQSILLNKTRLWGGQLGIDTA